MKISIWQQFSSNHSSSYLIVGRFASAGEANAAKRQLDNWIREYSQQAKDIRDNSTSIQKKIKSQYGTTFDLLWNDYPVNPVQCYENFLYFSSGSEADSWGAEDLTELIKKLGAHYAFCRYNDDDLAIELSCRTQNFESSEKIALQFASKGFWTAICDENQHPYLRIKRTYVSETELRLWFIVPAGEFPFEEIFTKVKRNLLQQGAISVMFENPYPAKGNENYPPLDYLYASYSANMSYYLQSADKSMTMIKICLENLPIPWEPIAIIRISMENLLKHLDGQWRTSFLELMP